MPLSSARCTWGHHSIQSFLCLPKTGHFLENCGFPETHNSSLVLPVIGKHNPEGTAWITAACSGGGSGGVPPCSSWARGGVPSLGTAGDQRLQTVKGENKAQLNGFLLKCDLSFTKTIPDSLQGTARPTQLHPWYMRLQKPTRSPGEVSCCKSLLLCSLLPCAALTPC